MGFYFDQIGLTWLVVAGVFILSFLVQVFYYLFFYARLPFHKGRDAVAGHGEPVSVVICARDEAGNLARNLPVVLEQDYPDYEVIVVDHASADNTDEVLESFRKKYKNLRTTKIKKDPKFDHGKKLAMTIGLKAAKHDWVLLTDADCRPASPLWITQMQKHFVPPGEIVLGYGGYERKKGLLDKIVRFDTFFIALQYISFALAGVPYMGVGRNLAYKRSLFFNNKGFASHLKLESGDDDLFINKVASGENTAVEVSHLSHTLSEQPAGWSKWIRQKRRHLTTGFHYRCSTRLLLGLELLSRLLFYSSFVYLIAAEPALWPWITALFAFRLVVITLVFNLALKHLNEKKLLLFSPIFDIVIVLINIFCVTTNLITKKQRRWR